MRRVIGWPTGVNQKIIDQTSMDIGEGGFVEDSANNSSIQERRLTSLYTPDTYNVVMDFDWLEKDENGMSEYDRFEQWYKYIHQRGVFPFEFPSISKFNMYGSLKTCQYKITSSLKPQKSGFSMRVSMTWKEVYAGTVTIPVSNPVPVNFSAAYLDHVTVIYSDNLKSVPLTSDYQFYFATKCTGLTTKDSLEQSAHNLGKFFADKITSPSKDSKSINVYFINLNDIVGLIKADSVVNNLGQHHFYIWNGDPASEEEGTKPTMSIDYWG